MIDRSWMKTLDKLVAKLKALGKLWTTRLILFLSDNGCSAGKRHASAGSNPKNKRRETLNSGATSPGVQPARVKAWSNASNTPPSANYKRWVHEGGMRPRPFIACTGPKEIKSRGRTGTHQPGSCGGCYVNPCGYCRRQLPKNF